ncbi:uncharacterized protein MONBRDRAFT_27484 [Monosiga brevicollis MX1]|uniref:Uncharacterized protein n=1 Tax=Monosiga brevicollis TaxID=81824 RepID=A9V5E7_MONBE|nr:uncharacterized protein MONBRDRAFT_27484 [Monosiga brevicollis MX1]EDQ87358.1 predicted protein [Monosiga brevicollis MX1]|eukprot:XP_001747971.1 hypothetical protein [Monosiga brevicollis MX1]
MGDQGMMNVFCLQGQSRRSCLPQQHLALLTVTPQALDKQFRQQQLAYARLVNEPSSEATELRARVSKDRQQLVHAFLQRDPSIAATSAPLSVHLDALAKLRTAHLLQRELAEQLAEHGLRAATSSQIDPQSARALCDAVLHLITHHSRDSSPLASTPGHSHQVLDEDAAEPSSDEDGAEDDVGSDQPSSAAPLSTSRRGSREDVLAPQRPSYDFLPKQGSNFRLSALVSQRGSCTSLSSVDSECDLGEISQVPLLGLYVLTANVHLAQAAIETLQLHSDRLSNDDWTRLLLLAVADAALLHPELRDSAISALVQVLANQEFSYTVASLVCHAFLEAGAGPALAPLEEIFADLDFDMLSPAYMHSFEDLVQLAGGEV